jgi:hypothetical protein
VGEEQRREGAGWGEEERRFSNTSAVCSRRPALPPIGDDLEQQLAKEIRF